MLVICIFRWLFPCLITVLRDWARDSMTLLKIFTIRACNNFMPTSALHLLHLSTWWFLLPRDLPAASGGAPGAWQGLPHWLGWSSKASSAGLFLLSPSGLSPAAVSVQGALWRFALLCIPPPQPRICWELSWRLLELMSTVPFDLLCAVLNALQPSSSPELHSLGSLLPRRLLCSPWASPLGHEMAEGCFSKEPGWTCCSLCGASFLPRFSALCFLVSNVWK